MNFFKYQNLSNSNSDYRYNLDPRSFCINNDLQTIYNSTSDELWIDSWLTQNQLQGSAPPKIIVPKKPNMTVHAFRQRMQQCLMLREKLIDCKQNMEMEMNTMTDTDWQNKVYECQMLQDDYKHLMDTFLKPDNITYMKRLVERQRRVRLNKKRKKQEERQFLRDEQERSRKLNNEIDNWQRNMKEQAEKQKMEEKLKKDRDCVLSEVNKKKSDARKQLSLISALVKLRSVRESMAVQRGERIILEDKQAFNIATEKLIKMWENRIKSYGAEEQSLRSKLEETISEEKLEEDRNIADEWRTVLFGESNEPNPELTSTYWALTASERDLETFIAVRKSWDTFLVPENAAAGSKIPVGWVLPNDEAIDGWTKYIC